jgi:plastocyanin
MKSALGKLLLVLALSVTAIILGCSSNSSSPTNSGGSGGGTKEFASGDLTSGQSFSHVFATAKSVPYFCRYHGSAGGIGMAGVITVTAGGTPTKHVFSIASSTLPTMSIHVMDTVMWTNNTAMVHTVESDN